MKRVLLFLFFAGVGTSLLLWAADGWRAPSEDAPAPTRRPAVEERPAAGPSVSTEPLGAPFGVGEVTGPHLAWPEHLPWRDPERGDLIEIANFVRWEFEADSFDPLTEEDSENIGGLCRNVTITTYREPADRFEALRLKRREPGARERLLHRRFRASEARAFGRIAERLAQSQTGRTRAGVTRDSVIHLTGDLHIQDFVEGLEIAGEQMTVYPRLETATGTGSFEIVHAAFRITGVGLELHRLDEGRTRLLVRKNPRFRMLGTKDAPRPGSLLDLAPVGTEETVISAEGNAILRRDSFAPTDRLNIEFRDHVRVEQSTTRTLEAMRLTLFAAQDAKAGTGAEKSAWRMRELQAEGNVSINTQDESEEGLSTLTLTAGRLVHQVPLEGVGTTLLEHDPVMVFHDRVDPNGDRRAGARTYVSCRDRAWIRPVTGTGLPPELDAEHLRRVSLSGSARIERHGPTRDPFEDVLEGDEIDLLFSVAPTETGSPAKESPPFFPGMARAGQVVPVSFSAIGSVRLAGTRLEGTTERLVARNLHTDRPHIAAMGRGTRFSFAEIGKDQHLLGPRAPRPENAEAAPVATAAAEPRWRVRRLRAEGDVDVQTSLGGPALGVPAQLTGHELSYDDLSGVARIVGRAGIPARLTAEALNGNTNALQARALSFERQRAIVRAQGTVRGEFYVALDRLDAASVRAGIQSAPPDEAARLEVRTDARIDVRIVREATSTSVQQDAEQIIQIEGPLTAELRSETHRIDRLRALSLEIAMILGTPPKEETRTAADAPPTARARAPGPRAAREEAERPASPPPQLSRVEIDAEEVTADISGGRTNGIEAFGGVELRSESGLVNGDRIVYRSATRQVLVSGKGTRKAEAIFGVTPTRNQILADQFNLTWTAGGGERLEARGRAGRPVVAHLYQRDAKNARRLEHYLVTCEGRIVMLSDTITGENVWVVRSESTNDGKTWGPPVKLWALTLRVLGENLLTAQSREPRASVPGAQKRFTVRRIVAEGAEGKDTFFTSGSGAAEVKVWGHRFELDVQAKEATLTGTPTRDVRFRRGARPDGADIDTELRTVTIDLSTGLPSYWYGGKLIWRAPRK